MNLSRCKHSLTLAALPILAGFAASTLAAPPAIKNIVLVHGAFVDGSGWQGVYDILVKDGYLILP